MGPGVLGLEVVRVIGPDEGCADRVGDPDRPRRDLALLLEPVRLHLHEVMVLAEDLLIPACRLERLGLVTRGELTAHLGIEAPGEHEEPVGVLGEELPVHARLVVVALEVGLGDEPHEIGVAGLVAHEDGAVAGALVAAVLSRPLEAAPRRDVELRAEDGLHARLHAGRVEIDAAEEVAVVGQGEGGEAQLLRALDELLEARGAVEQAVLRVDVQVNEIGGRFQVPYSHSMVLGGLEEMSKTTRFTPCTSLMMREEILPSRS